MTVASSCSLELQVSNARQLKRLLGTATWRTLSEGPVPGSHLRDEATVIQHEMKADNVDFDPITAAASIEGRKKCYGLRNSDVRFVFDGLSMDISLWVQGSLDLSSLSTYSGSLRE